MYILDSIGNLESLSIYLSRPSGEPLGCLDEYIDETSASMTRGLNQQQELTFDITNQDNDWYEYIQEGMYLYVETVGIFKMKQPTILLDGTKEIKSVTANSCDVELEDKNLDLEINMGKKTSQEYLVEYSGADLTEELINPYTGIPYDWIVLYNTFPEQLRNHLSDYDRRYFGYPDSETGDITVTERTKLDILNELFTMIPRLKNKFKITTDPETGYEDYELIEFADVTYNAYSGEVSKIVLYPGYRDRVVFLIDFYTRNHSSLSLLDIVLEETYGAWTVGDIYGLSDGDYTLANKKFQFEIAENIYSFLGTTLAQTTNCMVTFDIFNRKVNVQPVDTIGENTGVTISYDNLLNTLSIEPNEDNLATRLVVKGADDLSIKQVNFGWDYVDDITYKLNTVDENGKRVYVTDALAAKYTQYINYRENVRDHYIELSKAYNNYLTQISEIKNRVPADDLKTDWGTFTSEELETMLMNYKNLLAALISMYRSDFYPEGLNADDSVNENFMRTTFYWYDYEAYKNIIVELECALSTYPYYSDHDKWSSENKIYYEDRIKAWETEWSLFGTIELQAKIDTYKTNMDLLAESSVIKTSPSADTIKQWSELTSAEKTTFGNLEANYQYDNYMENYNNRVSAMEHLQTLLDQVADLEAAQEAVQTERVEIVQSVQLENYFTEDECKVISLLYRDADCTNENILVTSINSSNEKIDIMRELLEYGQEQVSITSRPQLNFSINSDNLLSLVDYKEFWDEFKVGNYILVQYRDDTFVKLRMVGYTYNPCLPSDGKLEITFSNYIRSKVGVTDLESLLGLSSGTTSSGGSGGGSSSGGMYGESDDIDITISNTMLAKLLNTETFGTRVKDVILNTIDVNAITARYATFNGLANGVTIIDGNCITTGVIRDLVYKSLVDAGTITNGAVNNTSGSVINLNNGYFNFAGGKIKYDGTLVTIDSDVVIGGSETVNEVLQSIITAQNTADFKSKIYYGDPETIVPPTYDELNEGDYLVDMNTGTTYRWSESDGEWIEASNYAQAIADAIEDLEEQIIIQIDAKIETWAQMTNPASSWPSGDLEKHNGDLWYYTGTTDLTVDGVTIKPSKTYQYNYSTGKWVLYNSSTTSLFDYADGKTTIYFGTTSDTYTGVETNDYLVDSTTGSTYKWSGSTWVKVTDYASAISSSINSLRNELVTQIDAKIETWAQNTNPVLDWNSSELAKHDADLWYYTGVTNLTVDGVTIEPSKTYIYSYSTGKWSLFKTVTKSLFDFADGKSTIYYGSTTDTYTDVEAGDYLVDSSTGNTYKWTGTAWSKVTDYSSAISAAVDALEQSLIQQIDAKIETWAQSSDPSISWATTDRPKHNGDLWFYTGTTDLTVGTTTISPSKTYQYSSTNNSWTLYNSPATSLFDYADGKSTIYFGTTSGTYANVETDDYLVDSTTGCTYKWNGSTWVKVTDYGSAITSAIGNLRTELVTQIDAKIETYRQSTDPFAGEASTDLESHDGDLWFYTGTTSGSLVQNSTYRYSWSTDTGTTHSISSWVECEVSQAVFDEIDGKTTIYYGTTSGSYPDVQVDDYLVDSTDGCTYKWTGAEWSKVTDYSTAITNSVSALRDELVQQIDSKVETWAQATDPALSWNATDFPEHDGDLWYYTGTDELAVPNLIVHPHGVYQFKYNAEVENLYEEGGAKILDESGNELTSESSYYWVVYSSASNNLFDMVDGKCTIYYGPVTETYAGVNVNDYLVDNITGATYKYDGTAWIKYTDYKSDIGEAIQALNDTLVEQIDGKVETWALNVNPETVWSADDLPRHDGDLWYYIGLENLTVGSTTIEPSKTYQYSYDESTETGSWSVYNSPSRSLFDMTDGKSTIYYGKYTSSGTEPSSPSTGDFWHYTGSTTAGLVNGKTYIRTSSAWIDVLTTNIEEGDYLVDSNDGCTYKWNGSAWSKVTDYETAIENSIDSLRNELVVQIDAKIETWSQATNPALSWDDEDLAAHDGDLWLYTGLEDIIIKGVTIHPQGTYKFKYYSTTGILDESGASITDESGNALSEEVGYTWETYSSSVNNLFDMTDGKSTIYYGTPSNSYPGVEEGDYLVNSQNGTTYRYTGGQWVATTKTGGLYAYSESVATAKEKIVVCNESISVYEGLMLSIKFTYANTYYSDSSPMTLNVGKLGVKNVYYNGETISSTNRMYWAAGATIMFMYDGIGWNVIGHPQTYQGTCSTDASTVAKNCFITDAVIVKGTVVNVTFTYTNSASSATLNVIDNTTNAPVITVDGSNNVLSASSQYNWNAGATVSFTFDGVYWKLGDSSALYNTNSYMKFESANGLMIANMTNGVVGITAVTTPNTLLTANDLQIRNGQVVLAKFGQSIELASSGANITIGSTDGYNSVIDNSGMLIRSGLTTLASFSSTIKIYSGSTAVVDISSSSATFTGVIKASSGEIGTSATNKIMIGTDATYASIYSGMSSFSSTTSTGFYIGADGFALGGGNFKVTNAGYLTSTSGTIGGWNINSTYLDNTASSNRYVYLGNGDNANADVLVIRNGTSDSYTYPFYVRADGTMVATKATMTGDVSSSNGELKLQSGRFIMYDGGVEIFRIRPTVYTNMSNVYNIDFQLATNRRYTTFSRGSTEMMRLGTDSDYYAWIWGNLYVSGTVTNSSDEKLKNIYKWNDVYDDVVQEISPIEFTWKDTKKDSKHHIGVGARNTKAVLDKYGIDNGIIVSEEEDHYSVAYNELIPMLLHSIQKDRKMILAIEKKLNELKKDWR